MTAPRPPGRIITFYSYKGGTGRTMLLANVAWVLASNGKRVLAVDWDLEAPGLHRYLHPFLVDPELSGTEGVIDFVTDYAMRAMTPGPKDPDAWRSLADLSRYAVSLEHNGFPADATLDFAPAGRQGDAYAVHVNSFNWQDFYGRLGGGAFIEAVKERLRADYDYVLIDSRTGVSDTAGICTVHLPDALVVCFTLNNQSIEGAAAVAESVAGQRPLRVYPVPTRIEFAEKQKLDLARARAHERFAGCLSHLDPAAREAYWGGVEVIYQPFYAYEEVLATFADRPGQPNSLLAAVERLTAQLTDGEVQRLVPPSAAERRRVLASFSGQPEGTADGAPSREEVDELARKLEAKEQEVSTLAAETERSRRRNRKLAAAGVVLALVAIGGLWAALSGGGSSSEPPLIAHADPDSYDFGVLSEREVVEVSVVADEEEVVHVHDVRIDGSGDFTIQDDGCNDNYLTTEPDGSDPTQMPSCVVKVAFDPGSAGEGSGPRHGALEVIGGNDETAVSVDLVGCKETCEAASG